MSRSRVRNSSNTVVKTIQTNVSEQTGFQYAAWDGTNDQDAVVPDGTYTVDIAASNADGQASLTYTRQVASGTPGQLTTPTNGATLSGTTGFAFTPNSSFTANFPISEVDFYCTGYPSAQRRRRARTAPGRRRPAH